MSACLQGCLFGRLLPAKGQRKAEDENSGRSPRWYVLVPSIDVAAWQALGRPY